MNNNLSCIFLKYLLYFNHLLSMIFQIINKSPISLINVLVCSTNKFIKKIKFKSNPIKIANYIPFHAKIIKNDTIVGNLRVR